MTLEIALYRNPRGELITHGSYSARRLYKFCPQAFKYERVDGWYDKGERAAPMFGKCTEAGIQYFEENDRLPGAAGLRFANEWAKVAALPDAHEIHYTACETDWHSLNRAGLEMMRLYEIRVPHLPISRSPRALFQYPVRKKFFKQGELEVLTNKAIFDIISYPNNGEYELIIDMKTSGQDLDEKLVPLDPQLLEYGWEYGCHNFGFLWLVKKGHDIEKGSRITLFVDHEGNQAGDEFICLRYEKGEALGKDVEGPLAPPQIVYATEQIYDEYCDSVRGLRGRALDNAKDEFITLTDGVHRMPHYSPEDGSVNVTKQRLQFAAAQVSPASLADVGKGVAKTTVEMVQSHQTGFYPRVPGIRFPDTKCNYCSYRWLCLNMPNERDKYLGKKGQEWLDEGQDDDVD